MDTAKILTLLDEAYKNEVTAIHQYMSHHYTMDAMGYKGIASNEKKFAVEEMKHAEKLGERILFYDGSPSEKPGPEIRKGGDLKKMLKDDLDLEVGAVEMYQRVIAEMAALGDFTSKRLLESLLADEEDHVDFFRTELEKIERLGDAYLATLAK
jgi:bacterioferritin